MDCVVCGCSEEVEIHGHYQCAKCGRMLDGDCCQGEQTNSKAEERERTYKQNRIRQSADNC